MAIAKSDKLIGEDVNLATNSEISIGALAAQIIQLINPLATIVSDEERLRPEKSEVFRLFGDNQKIQQYSDWKPEYDLKSGLAETIEWFSDANNLKQYKAGIYNV